MSSNRRDIERIFYSKRNFFMLCNIIRETVINKYGVDPKDTYKKDIYDTMNITIRTNIPPSNVNAELYNKTLNKKVLSQIIPKIDKDITYTLVNTSHNQKPPQKQVVRQQVVQQVQQVIATPQPIQMNNGNDLKSTSIQDLLNLNIGGNKQSIQDEGKEEKEIKQIQMQVEKKKEKPIRTSNEIDMKSGYIVNNVAPTELNNAKDTVNTKLEEKSLKAAEIQNPALFDINEMDAHNYNPRNIGDGLNQGGFPLIRPPKQAYIPVEHFVSVDSRSRNLEIYPNANYFQVKFSPASDNLVYRCFKQPDSDLMIYEGNIRYVADDKGANIDIRYNNVFEIECVQATVPYAVKYVCGGFPSTYNDGVIDQNKVADANNFSSYRYGPIYDNNVGIRKNVLDIQYLLLSVDEIDDGPYKGTNIANTKAFTKLFYDNYFGLLHSFLQLKPSGRECKRYEPSALASINKMTLGLRKWNNLFYDFGVDKTYVATFASDGSSSCNTIVTIDRVSTEYPDGCIESHGLEPGDLIYFHDTVPELCDQEVLYFNKDGQFTLEENGDDPTLCNLIYILTQTEPATGETFDRSINFKEFINVGDYIYIKYKYTDDFGEELTNTEYLQVVEIEDRGYQLVVTAPSVIDSPSAKISNIYKIGFAKPTKRGRTSNSKCDLNYIDGFRVCQVNSATEFVIDFPYDKLTYMQQQNYEKSVFFIKHKLQVNYTFRFVTLEKNFDQLESQIIR